MPHAPDTISYSLITEAAWTLTVMVAVMLLIDLRRDVTRLLTSRNVVLVGVFSWYLLEALQLPEATRAFRPSACLYGLFLVGVNISCFLYGYRISQARFFDRAGERVALLDDRRRQWYVLVLAASIGFLPVVVYGGSDLAYLIRGILGMRQTWGGPLGRGALGDFRGAFLLLETCVLGVSWLAVLYLADTRNPPGARMFALAIVLWMLLRAYGSGTRSAVFTAVAVIFAGLFWHSSPSWRRRLVLCSPLLGLTFYVFSGAMVTGRQEAIPSYVGHEMFRELLFIVDQVPEVYPYKLGDTYWAQAVNPIPRFAWEDKPLGFGVEFAAWHGFDALAGGPNMSPGIIGEMYVNFGLVGVVVCSFFGGLLCRSWDRLRERHAESVPVLMFFTAGLAAVFVMGRSISIAVLHPLIAAYVCLVLITGLRFAPQSRSRPQTPLAAE
jgi:hypothetical protein